MGQVRLPIAQLGPRGVIAQDARRNLGVLELDLARRHLARAGQVAPEHDRDARVAQPGQSAAAGVPHLAR